MSEPCQHGRDAETCAFCANERADQDRIRALEARVKELMIQGDRDRGIASQCNCSYEGDGFHSESCLMGRAERAEARAEKAEAKKAALAVRVKELEAEKQGLYASLMMQGTKRRAAGFAGGCGT